MAPKKYYKTAVAIVKNFECPKNLAILLYYLFCKTKIFKGKVSRGNVTFLGLFSSEQKSSRAAS
jgi:hypothetical protein